MSVGVFSITVLLRYLEYDIMVSEEKKNLIDLVCEKDINNEEQQLEVIKTVLVPGYHDLGEKDQESMKKALEICIQDNVNYDRVFMNTELPFEDEIIDKRKFFQNIYNVLFGDAE